VRKPHLLAHVLLHSLVLLVPTVSVICVTIVVLLYLVVNVPDVRVTTNGVAINASRAIMTVRMVLLTKEIVTLVFAVDSGTQTLLLANVPCVTLLSRLLSAIITER